MNPNEDLILSILRLALEKDIDGRTMTNIQFRSIPGGHSVSEIREHLDYCEKHGLIELGKRALTTNARVLLTPKGFEYVRNSER